MNLSQHILFALLVSLSIANVALASRLDWQFRLAGASSALSGRVEMRPNNTAPWGTICVDLFKENNYGPIAACNSAGLIGVTQAVFSSSYGAGDMNSPIYLTNVNCMPGQMFIQNCSTSELQVVGNCVHWEDVGVDCSPPTNMWQFGLINGTAPSNGILAIKPMPALAWGSVYYFYFVYYYQEQLLPLICAEVGYNLTATKDNRGITRPAYYVFNRINYYPTMAQFFPYYYVNGCPYGAKNIRECNYYQMGSQNWDPPSGSVYVDCRPPQSAKIPSVEVRLTNPWPGWRSGVGNIEIRDPLASTLWNNVCPVAFTYNAYDSPSWNTPSTEQTTTMKAICASSGYPGATNPMYRRYGYSSYYYNYSLQYYDYFADKFNCAGATLLSQCDIYVPSGQYYCGYTYYPAGIDCYSVPENRTQWEYRLWPGISGNGVTTGVFQMRPNRTAPWASVYSVTDVNAWDAMCRTIGQSVNASGYLSGQRYGIRKQACQYGCSENTSYWTDYVYCGYGDNIYYKDCSLGPLGSFQTGYAGYDTALDCDPPRYDPSQWEFRLVGNGVVGTGLLQFKPWGFMDWGYIIEPYGIPQPSTSYTWYPFNAKAICHSLGFMDVDQPTIQSYTQYLNYSAPIYFQYMRCLQTNQFVQNCSFQYRLFDTMQQSNYWSMGVECYPYVFKPMWRLSDGEAPWTGRLEYKYEENGAWGTVCNDYFKNNYIAWNAACHSVGYLNVTGARYKSYGPGSGTILWDDIQCAPGNFYIENCSKLPITQNNCFHGQDVGVNCYPPADRIDLWQFRLQDGTAATNGRLEMRPTSTSSWGTVCSDPFNHSHFAWLAACRSTGFPNVQRAAWRYFGKGPDTIYLDNVQCFANSSTLMNCTTDPIDSFFCTAWDAAGVDCNPPPETPGLWQFRLTGGTTASNGRLEMRPDSSSVWGNVCRNGLFNSRIALLAICKTIGYTAVRPVPRFFGKGKGTIYLDNATCAPGTNSLNQCSFNPLYSHACTHDMDMGIECFPSATVELTATQTKSKSLVLTLTKPLAPKKRTATHTPYHLTKTHQGLRTISVERANTKSVNQPHTKTNLRPQTQTVVGADTKTVVLPQTKSHILLSTKSRSLLLTLTPAKARFSPTSSGAVFKTESKEAIQTMTIGKVGHSQSPQVSESHQVGHEDRTHTANATVSIDGNGNGDGNGSSTILHTSSAYAEPTLAGDRTSSIEKTESPAYKGGIDGQGTKTQELNATASLRRIYTQTIIPQPSCELNGTASMGSHLFFSPMGSTYVEWPMTDVSTGSPSEASILNLALPKDFPLNSIADWAPAELWIYGADGTLARLQPAGVTVALQVKNSTVAPQLSVSLSASLEQQTFGNLFPVDYPDRSALIAMPISEATSCKVFGTNRLVVARIIFTEPAWLIGNAPQPDGEPHVENNHLIVPDPTFLNAPAEAAAIVRGVLPCDVRVPDASMAYYRMLSPFVIGADFFAVLLGTGVFLLFVLGMQVVSVLVARTFRVRRTLFGCAVACRAPAITIAVTQPLGLGVGFAAAALIAQSESHPENWIVGLAGCLIVAVLPFPILLFLYRCVSRRYVAYIGVAPEPFPAWLAPHIFPYGRQKPEMFSKMLAPLLNFRNVSPIWPIWTFLSPIGTMIIILVLGPMDTLCKHVFLALAVLHFLLAAIFAVYRPRRSTFLSLWTVLQLLISAIMFLVFALAVYSPDSEMLADLSYILCCIQTGFVASRIALTPVCFWSDRVLSYIKVKAVAEHIAPDGERFELNPGDADYQRDDEDARMANLDDDRLSDLGEEPLLMDIPKEGEYDPFSDMLTSPATKEVPDFGGGHTTSADSASHDVEDDAVIEDEEGDESNSNFTSESEVSSDVDL